ncbi:MAG: ligand-gated channel protein, partial [Bradyrhizobium sp.]|nr:ligand-gated channel protein [Bradyrhizobium sp.]
MSARDVWGSISLAGLVAAGWGWAPAPMAHAQQAANSSGKPAAETVLPGVTVDAPRPRPVDGRAPSARPTAAQTASSAPRRPPASSPAAALSSATTGPTAT